MKVNLYYHTIVKIGHWLNNFLAIQLYITLVSLPILIAWGIPISVASPIGNMIFSPFLTFFLLLSSIIFFTELIGIPNMVFIKLLEYTHDAWSYILSFGTNKWLLYYKLPSYYALCGLAVIPFAILLHKKMTLRHITLGCLAALVMVTALLTQRYSAYNVHTIDCNGKPLTLVTSSRDTMIFDTGALGHKISMPSWVEYSLIPLLAQTYGINTIDHLVILKPGKTIFDSAATLCLNARIKTIYLITWEGEAKKNLLHSYMNLKQTAQKLGITVKRIGYKDLTIRLDENHSVTFTKTDKIAHAGSIDYSCFTSSCVFATATPHTSLRPCAP